MRREIFGAALATVAREEVHRRASAFPRQIRDQPDKADAMIVNFQAWSAIADWLDHGFTRLVNLYGGAEDSTWIDWSTLEEAAAKELKALDGKLAGGNEAGSRGEQEEDRQSSEARAELHRRRDCIFCIWTAVANHRKILDDTTAEIRASIAAEKAAA